MATCSAPIPRAFADAVRIAVTSDDAAATSWLDEFVAPWFAATAGASDWHLHLSSAAGAYAELDARAFAGAARRACFALDTSVLSLPVAHVAGRLHVADSERSCVVRLAPRTVEVVGDPATRRWRFTALLVLLEIAATRMRRQALDLHAAAVALDGQGMAILGPKGAGKTTLWLYLLAAGGAAAMANDRAFVTAGEGGVRLYGVPTAVKLRPPTVACFPQLVAGLPAVERPYLYSLEELRRAGVASGTAGATADERALSPAQVLSQLAVAPSASARLAALLVPRIRGDLDGWRVAPIDPDELPAIVRANLYGSAHAERAPTLFEELDGGRVPPPPEQIARLAQRVPAYRVDLGRGAYADASLAARLAALARPAPGAR